MPTVHGYLSGLVQVTFLPLAPCSPSPATGQPAHPVRGPAVPPARLSGPLDSADGPPGHRPQSRPGAQLVPGVPARELVVGHALLHQVRGSPRHCVCPLALISAVGYSDRIAHPRTFGCLPYLFEYLFDFVTRQVSSALSDLSAISYQASSIYQSYQPLHDVGITKWPNIAKWPLSPRRPKTHTTYVGVTIPYNDQIRADI